MTMIETGIPTAVSARQSDELVPLAVTVAKACELTGLGRTSIWALLRDGKLEAVRPPGIKRTLIRYRSLAALISGSLNNPSRGSSCHS
jgi:excisionase family DNA binding protein